jgi:hypothetical protein
LNISFGEFQEAIVFARRPCTLTVPFLYFPTTKSWIRGLRKDKITSPHTFALLFKTIYVVVLFLSAIKSFCHQVSFFFADQ